MAQDWSSEDDDGSDDADAWQVRRNAHVALKAGADSVARDLWNQATRDGSDLYAGNPSDLSAIGLAALGDPKSYTPTATTLALRTNGPGPGSSLPSETNIPSVSEIEVVGQRPAQAPHPGFLDGLNHNLAVRVGAGVAGYVPGLLAGVGRGGWHAVEGVGHSLNFARSLFFPEGRAAAWNEAKAATHSALQYGRSVLADPSRLGSDAAAQGRAAIHSLVPFTTPIADTALGEMGHEFGIGMNGGEALANIVGLVAAPEVAGGVNAALRFGATREANIAEMMERGLNEPTARHLSKRYEGRGDHAVIQKSQKSIFGVEAPALKNMPIPNWLMESRLNVSRPRGMSQYDFYKYHYGVDPRFYGGRLPAEVNGGKGFSGRRLGFERYAAPGRTWARIPQIWKDYYAGVAFGDPLRSLPQATSETPQ